MSASNITENSIEEKHLKIHNTPSDGQVLSWDTTNGFEWADKGGGGGDVTLANLPKIADGSVFVGQGPSTAVVAKPILGTTQTSSGTLAYDSGTLSGSDSAGQTDPIDFNDVSDAPITSEAFGGGRLYRIAATYTFTSLRVRVNCNVNQGVAVRVRYSTTKPTTSNMFTHGTQLFQVGSNNGVITGDGTISSPGAELYFWVMPTADRTITNRRLRLGGAWTKSTQIAGALVLGNGLEVVLNTAAVKLDGSTLSRSTSGIKVSSGGVGSTELANDSVTEAKLDMHNSPSDGQVLTYDSTNGMQWETPSSGSSISYGSSYILGSLWTNIYTGLNADDFVTIMEMVPGGPGTIHSLSVRFGDLGTDNNGDSIGSHGRYKRNGSNLQSRASSGTNTVKVAKH